MPDKKIQDEIANFMQKLEKSAPPKGEKKPPQKPSGGVKKPSGVVKDKDIEVKVPLVYYTDLSPYQKKLVKEAIKDKVLEGKNKEFIEALISEEFNIKKTADWQKIVVDMIKEDEKGKVVKPEKPADYSTFASLGVKGFIFPSKTDMYYGKTLSLDGLVAVLDIPHSAKEFSPDAQLVAKAIAEPDWALKVLCVFEDGSEKSLNKIVDGLVSLWEGEQFAGKFAGAPAVEEATQPFPSLSDMPFNKFLELKDYLVKEAKVKGPISLAAVANKFQVKYDDALEHLWAAIKQENLGSKPEKPVTESKETTDQAIIVYLESLTPNLSQNEALYLVLEKFPLLHKSKHLEDLILKNKKYQCAICGAVSVGSDAFNEHQKTHAKKGMPQMSYSQLPPDLQKKVKEFMKAEVVKGNSQSISTTATQFYLQDDHYLIECYNQIKEELNQSLVKGKVLQSWNSLSLTQQKPIAVYVVAALDQGLTQSAIHDLLKKNSLVDPMTIPDILLQKNFYLGLAGKAPQIEELEIAKLTAQHAQAIEVMKPIGGVADYSTFILKLGEMVGLLAETSETPVPDNNILITKDENGEYQVELFVGPKGVATPMPLPLPAPEKKTKHWVSKLISIESPGENETIMIPVAVEEAPITIKRFHLTGGSCGLFLLHVEQLEKSVFSFSAAFNGGKLKCGLVTVDTITEAGTLWISFSSEKEAKLWLELEGELEVAEPAPLLPHLLPQPIGVHLMVDEILGHFVSNLASALVSYLMAAKATPPAKKVTTKKKKKKK